jgi:hypothetical protein
VICVREEQARALYDALTEIRKDAGARKAFRDDPKAVVPGLDDEAAEMFKRMSDLELACIAWVDENMEAAGFTHDVEGFTLRMV